MSETHERVEDAKHEQQFGHAAHGGGHGHGHAEAEADRANVGVIGLLLALTAIVLAVTSYMLWIYFQREAEAINYAQVLSRPSAELEALHVQERQWLESYGVVDREAGVYRVPVQQGAELFLQQARARRAAGQPQAVRGPAQPAGQEQQDGEAAPETGNQ